jgi:DNA-binding NarL/FixJ family response regulator
MRSILLSVDPAAVITEACDYAEAVSRLKQETFDLVLLDLMMPGGGGLVSLVEFVNLAGSGAVLVVSGVEDSDVPHQVKQCGARGFIAKTDPPDRIAAALRLVLNGGHVFPETGTGIHAPTVPNLPALTAKQLQVLELLAHGHSNKEIANRLQVSPNTIKIHVTEILKKLGVSSRSQAIALVRDHWPGKTSAL